jgi:transposase
MQVLHQRCCGLDVHKKTIVACLLITAPDGTVEKHRRSFSTMTGGLLTLVDWLDAWQISHVAMESTGVYWRAAFNLLEEDHTVILVNAQHMKAVPGHKTDVKDAGWLADLLRHGLLNPSFIPPKPIRELRELTRYRKSLVYQRTQEINHLHKVLETANIKLASVASNVLGKSGRDMVEALIRGTTDVEVLADLARGSLRKKIPQLQAALEGRLQPHHRLLLGQMLAHIDFLEASLDQVQRAIQEYLRPYEEALDLVQSIPGIQATSAATILAEIGTDMLGSRECPPSTNGVIRERVQRVA